MWFSFKAIAFDRASNLRGQRCSILVKQFCSVCLGQIDKIQLQGISDSVTTTEQGPCGDKIYAISFVGRGIYSLHLSILLTCCSQFFRGASGLGTPDRKWDRVVTQFSHSPLSLLPDRLMHASMGRVVLRRVHSSRWIYKAKNMQ